MNHSVAYSKYIDGILTFDEAFEGMTSSERYSLLNAQKLEIPIREKMFAQLEEDISSIKKQLALYQKQSEGHIERLNKARNSVSRLLEDSKKNLEKYANVLENPPHLQ